MGNYNKYRAVIILVGNQVEQIKNLFKEVPSIEKITFVGTRTSKIKEIKEFAISIGKKEENIAVFNDVVDEIEDTDSFGRALRLAYKHILSDGYTAKDMFVDISGGRKWMSAVAFSFAMLNNLDVVYIAGKKGPDGKIISRDKFIGNSRKLSVIIECDIAANDIKQYHWEAAYDRLRTLPEEINDKVLLQKTVSNILHCIWNFKMEEIKDVTEVLENLLTHRYKLYRRNLTLSKLMNSQLEFLKVVASDIEGVKTREELLKEEDVVKRIIKLFLIIYHMAEKRGDYNRCALLSYRMLEVVTQHRLLVLRISPREGSDKLESAEVKKEFSRLTKKFFGEEWQLHNSKIGLLAGMVIVCIFSKEESLDLGSIKKHVEIRNNMWLEHRFDNVDRESSEELFRSVRAHLARFLGDKVFGKIKGEADDFVKNIFRILDIVDNL